MKNNFKRMDIFQISIIVMFVIFSCQSISLVVYDSPIIAKATSENIVWNSTIRIESSDGTGNQLVFGEATDAKDEDKDSYDIMAPPFPPTVPNINTRFITNMEYPYDELIHEYKQYPDEEKIWNLSIVWLPEPGNESSTNITISWDSSELSESEYTSIVLQKNNTNISNMLLETSYIFVSSGNEPHIFRILCQKNTSDEKDNKEISTPFPSVSAGLITIMFITLLILHRRKANK